MARPVSSFYAQIGIQTRLQDLQRAERYLKLLEGKVKNTTAALQKDFSKTLVLPTLKIKKVQIDNTLNAQRSIQTDLNRIGRLTELRIGSVKLDEARITRQVSQVLTRASSKARMDIKTVLGTHGGSNIHWPGAGYSPRLPHMPNTQSLGQYAGAVGFGGTLGASLPMLGGPAGLAVAGVTAGGYMAYRQVDKLNQSQTQREAQRIALDVASGSSTREGRDAMNARFLALNDRLGLNAESSLDAFTTTMKQLSIFMDPDRAFNLYAHLAVANKGSGLSQQQLERTTYALQQVLGKGALYAEEMNQQISDANPGLRKYIIQAWEKETGGKGVEAFLKAMSKRQVTPEMLMNAIRAQARDVAPRVEEFASTAESAKNRLANAKFAEEMQRTLDDEMVPSIKRFTAAQQELHQATAPLRDGLYSLGAATLSATASLVSWSAKALENSPAMAKQASYEQRSEAVMAPSMGRGLLSVPNITRLQEKPRQPITPMLYQKPDWQEAAERYAPSSPDALMQQFTQRSNVSVQSSVSFQQGAFQIQTQATDAQTLAAELQPLIQEQFDVSLQRTLSEVDASFGSK